MRRINALFILFFALLHRVPAQLSIDVSATQYVVNFDNSLSGVNNGTYQGSGLQPLPGSGQLDGNAWEVIASSSEQHLFGQTNTSGVFARGVSSGGVTTSGLYAFEVAASDYAFGFQPSASNFTPGQIKLKIRNNTTSFIVNLQIRYEVWVRNDQNRSSSVDLSWSYDNSIWHSVPSASYTSPGAASGSPAWSLDAQPDESLGVVIPPGSDFILRWTVDDVSGSGSRDEFALDDISITSYTQDNPIIISEIMANPERDGSGNTLSEPAAEWFEIFNNTSYALDINGLDLEDNAGSHTVSGAPLINPGDYYALGRADGSLNGPYTSDYIYGTLAFSNSGDVIRIRYPDASVIDSVDFRTWSVPAGASLFFTGTPSDDNNLQSNWSPSGSREPTYTGSNALADNGSPGTGGSGQILPLRITRFGGRFTDKRVELYWELEVTDGISHFIIESSPNGLDFEARGELPIVANQRSYRYSFDEAYLTDIYLRIQQVDLDGSVFYSDIIYLENENAPDIEFFPNPATNQICVSSEEKASEARYAIYDLTGRLLNSSVMTGPCINVVSLPQGVYIIQLKLDTGDFNTYFVKH